MGLRMPVLEKKWARCPKCGAKTKILFDNTANIEGVYDKCCRNASCGCEYKLIVVNGEQYISPTLIIK